MNIDDLWHKVYAEEKRVAAMEDEEAKLAKSWGRKITNDLVDAANGLFYFIWLFFLIVVGLIPSHAPRRWAFRHLQCFVDGIEDDCFDRLSTEQQIWWEEQERKYGTR